MLVSSVKILAVITLYILIVIYFHGKTKEKRELYLQKQLQAGISVNKRLLTTSSIPNNSQKAVDTSSFPKTTHLKSYRTTHLNTTLIKVFPPPPTEKPALKALLKLNGTGRFDPSKPKLILLLAYQRVGSSFIGSSLFEDNQDFIYYYEPLDSIYTKLYGIPPGWAVPNALHFHRDGSYRKLPAVEKTETYRLMEQLFNCDFNNTITEYFIHKFWFLSFGAPVAYGKCMKRSLVYKVILKKCHKKLNNKCANIMGVNSTQEKMCATEMSFARANRSRVPEFNSYIECINNATKILMEKCIPLMQKLCESKKVRVMKTVRLEVDMVEYLMDLYPNMRVIHVLRNPKAVTLSRIRASSWLSDSTQEADQNKLLETELESLKKEQLTERTEILESIAKEAVLYCRLALRDLKKRHALHSKYPGRIYELLYEKVVDGPVKEVEKLYKFLDEDVPDSILQWARNTSAHSGTIKFTAHKWQLYLSFHAAYMIDRLCSELYQQVEFSTKHHFQLPRPFRPFKPR